MYIVNICGQKLGSCKFCKTLDSAMYNMHAKSGQMCRLLYVVCFTCILSLTVTKVITTDNKIKHCIKGIISNGFVFQLYCLRLTEAFTIAISTLQADVTVTK